MTPDHHSVLLDIWVKTLRAYRDLYEYQPPLIRRGTSPILDLVVLESIESSHEVWMVYGSEYTREYWENFTAIPDIRDYVQVAPASALAETMIGLPTADDDQDAWVLAIDAALVGQNRTGINKR